MLVEVVGVGFFKIAFIAIHSYFHGLGSCSKGVNIVGIGNLYLGVLVIFGNVFFLLRGVDDTSDNPIG